MLRLFAVTWAALALLSALGCKRDAPPSAPEAEAPRVFTLAYPTTWLAEVIGGDAVRVVDVRPEHDDPASWSPSQEIIFTIQEGAPVVIVGGGFEPWFRADNFTPFAVHRLVAPLGPAAISRPSGDAPNPYVWLEPEALELAARGLADHLAQLLPDAAAGFRARREALSERIAAFVRAHPADGRLPLFGARVGYEYAARAFGWELEVLAVNPAGAPSPAEVERWKTRREGHPARLVLLPEAPDAEVVAGLRAAGLEPVVFSLLTHLTPEQRRSGADLLGHLDAQLEKLAEARAKLDRP